MSLSSFIGGVGGEVLSSPCPVSWIEQNLVTCGTEGNMAAAWDIFFHYAAVSFIKEKVGGP